MLRTNRDKNTISEVSTMSVKRKLIHDLNIKALINRGIREVYIQIIYEIILEQEDMIKELQDKLDNKEDLIREIVIDELEKRIGQ